MPVIGLTSGGASPGTTSIALGLAFALGQQSGHNPVLIESDPDGGVLGLRFGFPAEPNLASYASALGRSSADGTLLAAHTIDFSGVRVLAGPGDPLIARWALNRSATAIADAVAQQGVPTVMDLGRTLGDSPASPLAIAADRVLIVLRPTAAEVQRMLYTKRALATVGCRSALVIVGHSPYNPQDVAELAGVPLLAVVPDDPKTASVLRGGRHTVRKFRKSMLWLTLHEMAAVLLRSYPTEAESVPVPAKRLPANPSTEELRALPPPVESSGDGRPPAPVRPMDHGVAPPLARSERGDHQELAR